VENVRASLVTVNSQTCQGQSILEMTIDS